MKYNCLWLGLTAVLLAFAAGCDYPQAGAYALIGKDADGQAVARLPFYVEELVDDTEMTTGYVVLLPAPLNDGVPQVVAVPVQNGTDFTRRSWLCAMAMADTRAGDLHVELIHADEQLRFSGAYRMADFSPVSRIAAALVPGAAGSNRIEFTTSLPQLTGKDEIVSWELVPLEQSSFEQAIGGRLEQAARLEASATDPGFLEAALLAEQVELEESAQTQASNAEVQVAPAPKLKLKPGKKSKVPPTMGNRGAKRPR